MNRSKTLEQLVEERYTTIGEVVRNSSPQDLLVAFKEAAEIDESVYDVIDSVLAAQSKNIVISEAAVLLDEESKAYVYAVEKLFKYYKENKNSEFGKNFITFLEAAPRDPRPGKSRGQYYRPTQAAPGAQPPVINAPTAAAGGTKKPGMLSRLGSWLGGAAKKVGGAISKYAPKVARTVSQTAGEFGGGLAGGLASGYRGATGGYSTAQPAPAAQPVQPAQPAPAAQQTQPAPAAQPAQPAPAAQSAQPAPAITKNELDELQQNLATAKFNRTAELNTRASELVNKAGVPKKLKDQWNKIKPAQLKESKFDATLRGILKNFENTSK